MIGDSLFKKIGKEILIVNELSHIGSQRVELFIIELAPATFKLPSSSDRVILAAKVSNHLRSPFLISLIKMPHKWNDSAV